MAMGTTDGHEIRCANGVFASRAQLTGSSRPDAIYRTASRTLRRLARA